MLILVVRNIAQNQKQINSAIMFPTIIHFSMVLLITSIGFFFFFVDHVIVASKLNNLWLVGKHSSGLE